MDLWFNKKYAKRLYFGSMLLMVVFVIAAYPFLPGRIISASFNLMGSGANSPKLTLLLFQLIFLAVYTLAGWGVAEGLMKVNPEFANIPNKDYWLGPSRRKATVKKVSAMGYWILFFTNVLIWIIFFRITVEQIAGIAISGLFFPGLICLYLIWVIRFCIRANKVFRRESAGGLP